MKNSCATYFEGIVDLASGIENEVALTHTLGCAQCAGLLNQLSATVRSLGGENFDAPISVVQRAASLMPETQPVRARLIASSLQAISVRAAQTSEAFQLRYEAHDLVIRVMYSRTRSGWDIMGRLSVPGWSVVAHSNPIKVQDDLTFQFKVSELSESGFEVLGNGVVVQIPTPEEESGGSSVHH